jgi:hypothetical protein
MDLVPAVKSVPAVGAKKGIAVKKKIKRTPFPLVKSPDQPAVC